MKSDAQITSDKFSSGAILFDGGVWYTFVLTSIEGGWNVKVLGTEYDYTHSNPDGRGICAVLYRGTSGWGFGVRAGGTAGAYKVYCTELRGEKDRSGCRNYSRRLYTVRIPESERALPLRNPKLLSVSRKRTKWISIMTGRQNYRTSIYPHTAN